jgi:ABC-type antimicrobial peptide transport system permease subunit
LDDYIEDLTDEFNFSFNTLYLYLPLITLAILLSNLAAAILLDNRKDQSKMLEEKGATSSNIISLISSEFLIITIIGISIGLPIALLLSTLIPAIKSDGTLNFKLARHFLTQMSVDFSNIYLMILIVFGVFTFFVGIQIYTAVFTKRELDEAWDQLQRFLQIGKAIFTISMVIGMVLLVLNITQGTSIQEINLNQQTEMILLIVVILFNIVWVLTSEYLSHLLVTILHTLDWFIHKLIPDVSYYINKNLRRNNLNIKRLAFFIIFLVSLLTYSTVLDATYENNNQQRNDFLQGADLRIHTKNTHANYSDILENIPGIELTTPLYWTNARIVLTDITIYAVDVKSYLKIGRWEYAQGIGSVQDLMQQLNTSEQKILISEQISNRLGHNVNDRLFLSGFEQEFIVNFTIAGMINSAPGIGLSMTSNPELNHNTKGWAIIPYQAIEDKYPIGYTELFLGKLSDTADIDEVINNIKLLPDVVLVNPSPIGENYIGYIIKPFLPSPNAVLLFIKFIALIFSIFLISMITESILSKRKRENAILISIGLSRKQLSRAILWEFILTLVFSSILGVLLGILLSIFSMQFFLPLTVKRIFVSIEFVINWMELITTILFIITMISIVIYYKIRKFFKETLFENIIKET